MPFTFRSLALKTSLKILALVLVGTSMSGPTYAGAPVCEDLFKSGREADGAMTSTDTAVARALIDRMFEGISERGFLSNTPTSTPELRPFLLKNGLVSWYLRIFVAKNLEAAKAHSALQPDPLMQGVYLLDPSANTEITTVPAPEVFKKLMVTSAMYEISPSGGVTKVSSDLIRRSLNVDKMTWDLNDDESGPYIKLTGWTFPRVRGVVPYANTVDSKTYKKMRALARKLVLEGFKISFNRDFPQALRKVTDQERRNAGTWRENSLYLDADLFNMTMDAYREGQAFSVEVWNEKDELVGGLIGLREGMMYAPESTFYDHKRYPEISIGFAKIAMVALMERLKEAGIPFADAGMVSPFTESMRGILIPGRDFLALLKTLPSEVHVDFTTDWIPPAAPEPPMSTKKLKVPKAP